MSEAEQDKSNLEALRDLDADSQDLERLEALLYQFNVFEATEFPIRGEERHSNFLAYLMNPRQNHALGDAFVKRFLQQVLVRSPNASVPVTRAELGLWDLGRMRVSREWWRIDILLLDGRNRLAVIIENKIGAAEHGNQLERYYETVREKYPDYKTVAIFLTPTERMPSHEEYLPVGYGTVCEVLEELSNDQTATLKPDVRTLITHYAMMLRRHIVDDSRVAKLSQEIYQKHKRAIDLIIEHRPNIQAETGSFLVNLIQDAGLVHIGGRGKFIVFRPQEWEDITSIDLFRFGFRNRTDELILYLESAPGDEVVRQKLFEMGQKDEALFNYLEDPASKSHPILYLRTFLTPDLIQEATHEELEAEVRDNWADFLENDLPRIDAALKQEHWIWESS